MNERTWREFDDTLRTVLQVFERMAKPNPMRLNFASPKATHHAAELTLFPGLGPTPPYVEIRRSERPELAFDLRLVVSAPGRVPEDLLAERGWFRTNPGAKIRTFARDGADVLDASVAVCKVISGLSDRGPETVFAEADPTGLLRDFLISTLPALDEEVAHGST